MDSVIFGFGVMERDEEDEHTPNCIHPGCWCHKVVTLPESTAEVEQAA